MGRRYKAPSLPPARELPFFQSERSVRRKDLIRHPLTPRPFATQNSARVRLCPFRAHRRSVLQNLCPLYVAPHHADSHTSFTPSSRLCNTNVHTVRDFHHSHPLQGNHHGSRTPRNPSRHPRSPRTRTRRTLSLQPITVRCGAALRRVSWAARAARRR
jgi:hypothetical protein